MMQFGTHIFFKFRMKISSWTHPAAVVQVGANGHDFFSMASGIPSKNNDKKSREKVQFSIRIQDVWGYFCILPSDLAQM